MIYHQTDTNAQGESVTTLWRAIRANKEDRVAKLEWAPNGGLGRAVIGKVTLLRRSDAVWAADRHSQSTLPMADLVRPDPRYYVSTRDGQRRACIRIAGSNFVACHLLEFKSLQRSGWLSISVEASTELIQ